MRRRLVLLVAFVAFVAWLATSGLGSAATAAAGGTTASVQGETVTITVHLDLCCTQSASDDTVYGPIIQEEVTQAQAIWNTALAKLPVDGCVKLRVAFDVHLLNHGSQRDKGYHQIEIDFTKSGMSFSNDLPTFTPYDDTTTVYTQPVDGQFYDAGLPVVEWAHELGHLMGLGDDYSHGGYKGPHGDPLPGRANTMMADKGPHTIDQNLADRLADIANRAGAKIPGCDWTGTIESDSQNVTTYSGGQGSFQCNDHWHTDFSFTVQPGGSITGTGKGTLVSGPSCSGDIDTAGMASFPPAKEVDLSVSGSKQTAGFTLTFGYLSSDGVFYGGFGSLFTQQTISPGPALTVPITGPCAAGGTVPTSDSLETGLINLTANNVLALKCKPS